MQRWPSPHVPLLPGHGSVTRLYAPDIGEARTAGGPERAGILVWTPLPADGATLVDAATAVVVDVLVRAWRDAGIDVRHVQVVDDLADDLLEGAAGSARPPADVAHEAAAEQAAEMTALGVLPPDALLASSELSAEVITAVEKLLAQEAAYRVALPDGPGGVGRADVYADLGVDPVLTDRPRVARDPVVWRAVRDDGPVLGAARLGPGRPGPSLTCAVAGLGHLGEEWDVLAGAGDLAGMFALGESHARVLSGLPRPVRRIVQVGRPRAAGELTTRAGAAPARVSALLRSGAAPAAVRLLLLAHHYRTDWEYTPVDLLAAESRLDVWTAAVSGNGGPPAEDLVDRVRSALADDLDTPSALAAVDDWAERSLSYGRAEGITDADVVEGAPGVVARAVDALLGVRL